MKTTPNTVSEETVDEVLALLLEDDLLDLMLAPPPLPRLECETVRPGKMAA
jgi:hypothetical protein